MTKPATDRLKVNPPLGMMPALQYLLPVQLNIDASYQRSLDTDTSRTLVRSIAQHWNWDLCQPLVVSRRDDGALYVIDGQHRLAAARLRGDIAQLPAVVVQYASAADEAASFVNLNQQRRPLTKLDLFKASVASGDTQATAILEAIVAAGLRLANNTNPDSWKPGQIINIGGIEGAWRIRGARVVRLALRALAEGFTGQVLRYAGTLFPGLVAVCAIETNDGTHDFDDDIWQLFIKMVSGRSQENWRSAIMLARADEPNLNYKSAGEKIFTEAWQKLLTDLFDTDGDEEPLAAPVSNPPGTPIPAPPPATPTPPRNGGNEPNISAKAPIPSPRPATPPKDEPKAPSTVRKGRPVIPQRLFSTNPATGAKPTRAFQPDASGKGWCDQCDRLCRPAEVSACQDRFCPYRGQ